MFADLSPDRYRRLTAKRAARLVADGTVSPVHLAEHALASAKAAEPRINAYVRFLEDDALRAAGDREAEARAGRLRGKLHGVPITVKDNFYLAGHPVSRGSCTAPDAPVTENAPMIERVLAAGAVIVGKTTMPEFGWKGTGSSPLTGITRNPWDLSRNPGGSSSGSAATVAAGAVPIALGSDAGGSIRIPAAWADTELDIPLPRGIFETLWVTGRGFGFSDVIAARGAEMDPGLVRCGALAEGYSLADFLAAMDDRRKLNARLAATLEKWDVLVTPTMPLTAFAAEDEVPPGGEADAPLPWVTWTPYTYPFNLSGQPAVSIPCGFDSKRLPVGLQIVAKWGADSLALAVARRFERILGRARPAPVNAP
ncbi:MAG: amidase family protein [Defluviicoccus sp.]|nr:amidase family protein [Defluviicoccus sp.]